MAGKSVPVPEDLQEVMAEGTCGIKEACTFTGLKRDQFYKAIAAGELRSFKHGKRRLIAKSDLKSWMARKFVPQS